MKSFSLALVRALSYDSHQQQQNTINQQEIKKLATFLSLPLAHPRLNASIWQETFLSDFLSSKFNPVKSVQTCTVKGS